jgi:hypothetical protein
MPAGTKVHKMYEALKDKGMDKGKAARIAQAKTGLALATGKHPKGKKKKAEEAKPENEFVALAKKGRN